jgi:hypothetical protein
MSFSRRFWSHFAPLIILCLLWGGVFWRVLFASGADRVLFPPGDFYNHYYNFATYQVERWHAGAWPLWNPYNGAGDPFAANIQLNTFYPVRWLTALIWGGDGWQVIDHMREGALHILLTSLLMFGFVRHKTRRAMPALIGAVLWAYGGYLMSYPLQQTAVLAAAVWLPLIMWGTWLLFQTRRLFWGIFAGSAGIALSLLGGHPQTTLYMMYAVTAYGLYVGTRMYFVGAQHAAPLRGIASMILRLGVMFALGGALSAMQILPSLEFMRLSGRLNEFTYEQKAQGFLVADVYQIFLPGLRSAMSPLYASLGGACLAVLTLFPQRSRQKDGLEQGMVNESLVRLVPTKDSGASIPYESAIWWLIGLAALAIGLGAETPLYAIAYKLIPGISFFRQPERIALIVQFALVMLAVNGYRTLSEEPRSVNGFWRAGTQLFAIGALAALALNWNTPQRDLWALIFLNAILFAIWVIAQSLGTYLQVRAKPLPELQSSILYSKSIGGVLFALLLAFLALDLVLQTRQSIPYVSDTPENRIALAAILEQTQVLDPTQIVSRVDGAVGLRDDALAFRVPNIYHAGPLSIAKIEDLRRTTVPVDRFWEVLSVRYATLSIDKDPPPEWHLISVGEGINSIGESFRLFELPNPRPLATLIYDSRDAGGSVSFAREIMADGRINLRDIAIATEPLNTPLPSTRPTISQVSDLHFQSPESLTLHISTETNALLSLSIPRYPGWQAWVNGVPTETVEIYAGLIGIPVSAGMDQQIELKFISRPVEWGILMSLGAGLLWLGVGVWAFRRHR